MPTGIYERTPCEPGCDCGKHRPYVRSPETRAKLSAAKKGRRTHPEDCPCGWCGQHRKSYDGLCVDCGDPIDGQSTGKRCRNCYNRTRYQRDPERQRRVQIKHLYGITVDEYCALLDRQDGACALCRRPAGSTFELGVDHDHACCPGKRSCGKCVRGLLCDRCNRGLGYFRDDPEALLRAVLYLRGAE